MKNMWFNWKHLRLAEKYSSKTRDNPVVLYFKHMWIGFREAGKQLLLAFASFIIGFILSSIFVFIRHGFVENHKE